MKVSKKSIWDQLYQFPDSSRSDNIDICRYVRGVLRGIFVAILAVGGGVLLSVIILNPYFVGIMTLVTGVFIVGELFWLSIMIQAVLGGIVIFATLQDKRAKRSFEKYEAGIVEEPSFLGIWYKSFKEKTCFLIERV
jgi:hypothetical protein